MLFKELKLKPWLLKLVDRIQYKSPTAIQEKSIPYLISGQSITLLAPTGSGKTAAFGFPLLHKLSQRPFSVFAIIIVPNRQLALQIQEKMLVYGQGLNLRIALLIGGTSYLKNWDQLSMIPHIVVGTPGRIEQLLRQNQEFARYIKNCHYLVLDQADRLFDDSILPSVSSIIQYLNNVKQVIFSSATLQINKACQFFSNKLGKSAQSLIKISTLSEKRTVNTLVQLYVLVPEVVKLHYLSYLIKINSTITIIIFIATCKQCQLIHLILKHLGYKSSCLHSSMKQVKRIANLTKFKNGDSQILVTTDVSARGLDIPQVQLVINYTIPKYPVDYIHRVGRTARAGKQGKSISLTRPQDISRLLNIQQCTGVKMQEQILKEEQVLKQVKKTMKALKDCKIYMLQSGITQRLDYLQKRKLKQKQQANKRLFVFQ